MAQLEREPTSVLTFADLPLRPDEASRSGLVDFEVTRDSEVPIGTQLVWKLRAMIARGALREGDRLPSVRELAQFSGVNINTGRAAYATLEEAGLIASEHGRGTFVTERAGELLRLGGIVDDALAAAAEAGFDPREAAAVLFAAGSPGSAGSAPPLSPLPPPDATLSEPAQRRILREQIAHLETELAAYAWDDVRAPGPARLPSARPVPRVAGVAELESVRNELIERLARLRGEAQRRGIARQRAFERVEAMVRDPAGHRWEIVTNEETGEPGCKDYRVVPRFGPLGAVMGWWRVKVSSGCPSAAAG